MKEKKNYKIVMPFFLLVMVILLAGRVFADELKKLQIAEEQVIDMAAPPIHCRGDIFTEVMETIPVPDKTKPIYEVYADDHKIEVPAEWQWYIRELAEEHNYPEKIIYGLIIRESWFNPKTAGDNGRSHGLCQIQPYWIKGAKIDRLTENAAQRNLFDPYDNLITLMEIWNAARTIYKIDTATDQGMKDLLYWHNTGKYIKDVKWQYSEKIFDYADQLVEIKY